jgi:hypothetical protein
LTSAAGKSPAIFDKRKFWEDSLAIIGKRIDRFCEL